jgi:hypothetical protein
LAYLIGIVEIKRKFAIFPYEGVYFCPLVWWGEGVLSPNERILD